LNSIVAKATFAQLLWHSTPQCTIQKIPFLIFGWDETQPQGLSSEVGFFFFLFLSPRPWPAKVSSKKNPATYPSQLPTQTLNPNPLPSRF
jgi:hypothetical protein